MNQTHEGTMKITSLVLRGLTATAVAAVAVLGFATPANAHASLADSNPKNGASLEQMPETLSVTLNEPVAEPAYLVVTDSTGKTVAGDGVSVDDKTVTTQVDRAVPAGDYTLAYRVVSVDGHAVTGKIDFALTPGAAPSTPTPRPSATTATPDEDVTVTRASDTTDSTSAYVVIAFFVVAMAGLIWMVRAGLKSTDAEDDA